MKKSILAASVVAMVVTAGSGALLAGNVNAAEAVQKIAGHFEGKGAVRTALESAELTTLLGMTSDELKTALKSGKSLAAIAGEKGVDVQKVIDLETKALTAELDKQLKDGRITQAEYDTRKAGIAAAAKEIVNGTFIGKGRGGDREGRGGFGPAAWFDNAELASLLGMTEDELEAALKSGKSLATIAGEQKVGVDKVTAQVTKAFAAELDERLADGAITQAQYDEQKAALAAKAAEIVNGTFKGKGDRGEGGHGEGGHGARGGHGFGDGDQREESAGTAASGTATSA